MKVPPSLLKAMLVTVAVSAVATGCKTTSSRKSETYQIQQEEKVGVFGRIRNLFVRDNFICEGCGRG